MNFVLNCNSSFIAIFYSRQSCVQMEFIASWRCERTYSVDAFENKKTSSGRHMKFVSTIKPSLTYEPSSVVVFVIWRYSHRLHSLRSVSVCVCVWSQLYCTWTETALTSFRSKFRHRHRGSTGPAEHLVRTTELPIWPPLSACVRNLSPF